MSPQSIGTNEHRNMAGLAVVIALVTPGTSAALTAPPPVPTCATARPTPSETEGPFYKPGSPERTSLLEPGMPGTKITVTGYVLSTRCRPIGGAWLRFLAGQ